MTKVKTMHVLSQAELTSAYYFMSMQLVKYCHKQTKISCINAKSAYTRTCKINFGYEGAWLFGTCFEVVSVKICYIGILNRNTFTFFIF